MASTTCADMRYVASRRRTHSILRREWSASTSSAFAAGAAPCSDFEAGVGRFQTIKAGAVEGRNGRMMTPHVNLGIVARGVNIGLNTWMYFSIEVQVNAQAPVINLIGWEVRRDTLIARREGD